MGIFSKEIKTMNDLFVHQLQDVYYAEKRIVATLPKMIDKATDAGLRSGFEQHLAESKEQVTRIEQVFELYGAKPKTVTCQAIDGIIKEAEEVAGEVGDSQVLDAALIAAAQAVEHYEIARYGTLVSWAKRLDRDDCAALLEKTLAEEKATDAKLTKLADGRINQAAAA